MTTKPRIIVPHLIYQVTSKGARNTAIFSSPELKHFFLGELQKTLKRFSYQCLAWSIMDDHYHLVLKSSDVPVSLFMQRLNSIFAKHFNKIRNESGVVFSKRFASIVVEVSNLKDLVRYVHLNPVRCGNCTIEQLTEHQWCGHQFLVSSGSSSTDCFQNTAEVLKCFSGPDASKEYDSYVRSEVPGCGYETMIKHIRDANRGMENFSKPEPWILGSEDFVMETIESDRSRRLRIARHIREKVTFEVIHERVVTKLSLQKAALYRQGRGNMRTEARNLFAFIGKTHYEFTEVSLSNYLGVSSSAISKMISKCGMIYDRNAIPEMLSMVMA